MTQIVNFLTSKMEIDEPMASLYILEYPDHCTNHRSVVFYWKMYVNRVLKDCKVDKNSEDIFDDENVVLSKSHEKYIHRVI
jgi:hypothetical protein